MGKIKAVIDTNVLVSSLIGRTKSNPKEIIDRFKKDRFFLVLSPPILKELEEVLKESEFKSIINESLIKTGIMPHDRNRRPAKYLHVICNP